MSEEQNICQNCSHENKLGAKFCGHCGNTIKAVSSEKLDKFKAYLEDMLLDGEDPRENEGVLIAEAVEDMGIPLSVARRVLEEVCNKQTTTNVGIKISYDAQLAKSGVAQGNSILVLRVENLTPKSFGSVSISLTHPEEGNRIELPKIRSLTGQKTKNIETTLRFNLVGAQLITDGQVKVEALSGLTDVYSLASPIRMSTENSNASRHTHTSVNQTITTNGGGVVDGSGFTGGITVSQKSESWEVVRLMRSNFKDKVNASQNELTQEIVNTTPASILISSDETASIKENNIDDSSSKSDINLDTSSTNEELLDLGQDITEKIDELIKNGENQTAKLAAINEFLRLLSFYPKILTASKGGIYLSTDIDLALLTTIANTAKIKRADISAIAVNKASCNAAELESFNAEATVFSSQGLITLSAKNGTVELADKYGWSFLAESGWGVFKQNFGKNSYILSIGDEATDYCLPNLTFDLRKNNGKLDIDILYSRLHDLFEKTKKLSDIKSTPQAEAVIESHEHLNNIPAEEEDLEDDPIELAVRQFFAMFAFASQFCDESNDRPIHVFVEEENGGDVDIELAKNIQALFPKSKLIAICEEDLESAHDSQGRILNWTGDASVVTRDGIFHVNSDGEGNYDISSKQAFLSWSKFFEDLKADLIVRWNVPDIWLGTFDYNFIKGAYIDFSMHIDSFIYFEEFFHNDLRERFESLREIIENA
jgi:hypothetical protein